MRGSVRWAPFPGGPQKCRILAGANHGNLAVLWQTGPLKGHEARIPVAGLRVHKRDVPCGNFCDYLLCPTHGLMS